MSFLLHSKTELNRVRPQGQVQKSRDQHVKQTLIQDLFLLLLSCTALEKSLARLYALLCSAVKCQ